MYHIAEDLAAVHVMMEKSSTHEFRHVSQPRADNHVAPREKSLVENDALKIGAGWQSESPAAQDFRSDVCTTSMPVMLQAIIDAGINDGWTASGGAEFEADMARLTGREAGLFMSCSIMGNQVSLRTHFGTPPYSLICDERSHLIHMEAGGVGSWSGALVITTMPSNGIYLTLEDIQRKAVLSDGTDSCTCPTRLIHLENPLGGLVMPLTEVRRICEWAHAHQIKVHLDGARLWEAAVSGAGTIPQFCSGPDSVNLCLTKGLGGAVGSIVVGDRRFIKSAKWVKKTVGGTMRQPGFVTAAASAAVKYAWGNAVDGSESLLKPCHVHAARLADAWTKLGGRLLCPQGTNMIWLDLDYSGIEEEEWELGALKRGLKLHCGRIVVHFQISDTAVELLESYMSDMLTTVAMGRKPLGKRVPRNEAVSRLAASMQDAWSRRVKGPGL